MHSHTMVKLPPGLVLVACLLLPGTPLQANTDEAQQLVQQVTTEVLERLEANRAELEADTSGLYDLIHEIILPHIHFDTISRWVMGRSWRGMSAEQREQFTEQFRRLLLRTYATSLLRYSDEEIRFLTPVPGKKEDRVMIRTEVQPGEGQPVPVNYRMRRFDMDWQVVDLVINGISMVQNYRGEFEQRVRQSSVDVLLEELEERNRSVQPQEEELP